jgi:hypothetical protein
MAARTATRENSTIPTASTSGARSGATSRSVTGRTTAWVALARLEGRVALARTLKHFPTWEIDDAELGPVHTSTVRGFSSVPIHLR